MAPTGTATSLAQVDSGRTILFGQDGNLYLVSQAGGVGGQGCIYQITTSGIVTTEYTFGGASPGTQPSVLVQAPNGTSYGSTQSRGTSGEYAGTIFSAQIAGGNMTLSTIYSYPNVITTKMGGATITYTNSPVDLVLGADGNIYGTATNGEDSVFFRLTPSGTYTVSHTLSATTEGETPVNGSNAPTSLDGISATIGGKPTYIWYLSPTQINIQAPEDTFVGKTTVSVTNCKATSPLFGVTRRAPAPGLLSPSNYVANGAQYLVATFASDGAYVLSTALGASFGLNGRPAKPGDVVVAYGIGFGDVTPSILPGTIAGAIRPDSLWNCIPAR